VKFFEDLGAFIEGFEDGILHLSVFDCRELQGYA
jgi:hypothetical protein